MPVRCRRKRRANSVLPTPMSLQNTNRIASKQGSTYSQMYSGNRGATHYRGYPCKQNTSPVSAMSARALATSSVSSSSLFGVRARTKRPPCISNLGEGAGEVEKKQREGEKRGRIMDRLRRVARTKLGRAIGHKTRRQENILINLYYAIMKRT